MTDAIDRDSLAPPGKQFSARAKTCRGLRVGTPSKATP